jgi:hypothetical protein
VYSQGSDGLYLSSTLFSDYPSDAYFLYFNSYGAFVDGVGRCDGFTVRAVLAE